MRRSSLCRNVFRRSPTADQVVVIDDGQVVGAGTHESLLADCPTYAEFADSQSVGAGIGGRPMTAAAAHARSAAWCRRRRERSRDFKGSAIRLVKRLTPQRGSTAAVILLGVGGIAIGVIGPRILGHATDLLFNGVIGRQLPAGHHQGAGHRGRPGARRQHVRRPAVRHERGAGPRRGLRRRRPHAAAGAGAVSGCRAAGLGAGPTAQRRGAAHHGGAAVRRRGQGAPAAAVATSTPGSAARC